MIKKKDISKEDIDTWQSYIKNPSDIIDKDQENIAIDGNIKKGRFKYDLHGHTLFEANKTVEAKSSAFPNVNFAIKFAVVGSTIIKSAHLDRDI